MKTLALAAALALTACSSQIDNGTSSTAGGSSGAVTGGSGGGGCVDAGCASGRCAVGDVCNPCLETDPCAAQGFACSPDYTGASVTGAFCELPGEYFDCLPSVGCASSDLQCIGADAGEPGGCFEPCTTTADCEDPLTVCTAEEVGEPKFCQWNTCSDFWQTCSAESTAGNDGTCVYLYDDPQLGPQGACLQGGSVPSGGDCNYYRAADAGLCTPGTVCIIDASAQNSGICLAACDGIADGGPACGGVCVLQEPPAPPPAVSALDFTQAGGCATACSAADPNCPNGLTCYELDATGTVSACLP
jgi:hypothetical protein